MQTFPEYIRQRLENNGYQCKQETADDLFATIGTDRIWICYLHVEITPEMIRRCFDFPGHILFVVDEKLIPQEIVSRTDTPMWLRVLHGLYMGRIYTWNGRHLFGLHFDYDTGDVSESGIIQPDELLLVENTTWLHGWAGIYKLARFYDKRWWGETTEEKVRQRQNARQQSNARSAYEQARDHYWEQQRARDEQRTGYDTPWAKKPQADSKPDFMREFARAGSPSAVKALYRELAKKYHPDLNPGIDTTAEMQAVNAAYEVYR